MGTPKGILRSLIVQSEPRLAEITCIDILEALPGLQDGASILEHQPNQAAILCHADIGHPKVAHAPETRLSSQPTSRT